MSSRYYPLFFVVLFSSIMVSCEELGIDPEVSIADCLTEEDLGNYELFVANEKNAVALLQENGMDPDDVPNAEKEALKNTILESVEEHDKLRKGFDCQYWGENVDFLEILATNGSANDPEILDPEKFRALFKVQSADVLEILSSDDWVGQEVYVFPGISRIPWEGSSQANKEEALTRINQAFNDLRSAKGIDVEVDLFDPVNDYLFPHASFHQIFLVQYQAVLDNPDNVGAKNLVSEMTSVQEAVMEKLILRSPDAL